MTREERYTQWRNMIEAQAASGMTVAIGAVKTMSIYPVSIFAAVE